MTDHPEALSTWHARLNHLLQEEAQNADPSRGFQLKNEIADARAKIKELGGPNREITGGFVVSVVQQIFERVMSRGHAKDKDIVASLYRK